MTSSRRVIQNHAKITAKSRQNHGKITAKSRQNHGKITVKSALAVKWGLQVFQDEILGEQMDECAAGQPVNEMKKPISMY